MEVMLRREHRTAAGSIPEAYNSTRSRVAASVAPNAPDPQQRSITIDPTQLGRWLG